MIDFRQLLGLRACLVCALLSLASCEGATYVNQHFTNQTDQPIFLVFRTNEAATGWDLDTLWTIDPGVTLTHYAVDTWGKCHDCSLYETLPFGIDTLWVAGRTSNVDLQDSLLWTVEVDDGLSWIRFDQWLELVPAYFE